METDKKVWFMPSIQLENSFFHHCLLYDGSPNRLGSVLWLVVTREHLHAVYYVKNAVNFKQGGGLLKCIVLGINIGVSIFSMLLQSIQIRVRHPLLLHCPRVLVGVPSRKRDLGILW